MNTKNIAELKEEIQELKAENDELTYEIEDLKDEINELRNEKDDRTADYQSCINLMDAFDEFVRRVGLKHNNTDVIIFRKDLEYLLDVKR